MGYYQTTANPRPGTTPSPHPQRSTTANPRSAGVGPSPYPAAGAPGQTDTPWQVPGYNPSEGPPPIQVPGYNPGELIEHIPGGWPGTVVESQPLSRWDPNRVWDQYLSSHGVDDPYRRRSDGFRNYLRWQTWWPR